MLCASNPNTCLRCVCVCVIVNGGLHDDMLHDLKLRKIRIRMIKSRVIRWPGHVARSRKIKYAYNTLVGKPRERGHVGDQDEDEGILK